ncbi:MAG: hypothetical protein NTW72_06490 [Gemmatimonadetes bacterium]|nr:hypothetical protein [Gemmatimonadota bacterium]
MRSILFAVMLASGGLTLSSDPAPTLLTTPAFDQKTGRLIYVEERKQFDEPGRLGTWRFTYRDAAGETIVRRQVHFEKSTLKPSFRLDDLRNGYAEGAELVGDKIKVFRGGSAGDPYRERLLTVPEPAVVDAGFNAFVEHHWNALMKGDVLHVNFVAPSQLDYFKFRVYKARETTHQRKQAVVLKMDIDHVLLRLFVDAIQLTYDKGTKQLLVYDGMSNIYDDQGKPHRVRMEFSY